MKTLESILQGVTLPEHWKGRTLKDCVERNTSDANADFDFAIRAIRNFAPLVRALNKVVEVENIGNVKGGAWFMDHIFPAIDEARQALAQALADEP